MDNGLGISDPDDDDDDVDTWMTMAATQVALHGEWKGPRE